MRVMRLTTVVIASEVASSWKHCAELHGYYCSDCCRVDKLLEALCQATRLLLRWLLQSWRARGNTALKVQLLTTALLQGDIGKLTTF